MSDPAPEVRAACMAVLGGAADDRDIDPLLTGLTDPSAAVRRAAAAGLATRPAVDPRVLALLGDAPLATQATAIEALSGHGQDEGIRDMVVAWADAHVERARAAGAARIALETDLGPDPDATATFLLAVLDGRVAAHRDLALAAMTVLGAPEAGGVIRRRLGWADGRCARRRSKRSIDRRSPTRTASRAIDEPARWIARERRP